MEEAVFAYLRGGDCSGAAGAGRRPDRHQAAAEAAGYDAAPVEFGKDGLYAAAVVSENSAAGRPGADSVQHAGRQCDEPGGAAERRHAGHFALGAEPFDECHQRHHPAGVEAL